jgi:secondary thiamine-phosphate synthase enzyme
MVLHATAAIVVNENDDPNIGVDLLRALNQVIPEHDGWLHDRVDDNAQAHILAATLGPAETIAVEDGELVLGRWQGVMLVELDGPRERTVAVTVIAAG